MRRFAALLSLVLLVACSPQVQPFSPATHAPKIEQGAFTAADAQSLPLRSWKAKNPKAIVLALHGFNDYSNAFEGTGNYFKTRGITTFAYDQRGFGKAPQPGIWAGQENLIRDAHDVIKTIAKRYPKTPVYLMGESMGGAVAMLAASDDDLPIKGVILSAPAVWSRSAMPMLYRGVLWGSAHTIPGYKLTGKNLRIRASNNISMLRALGADPLFIKATRIDAIYGLVNMMDDAYEAPEHIEKRVLLLYGFKDQVIPKAPIKAISPRFKGPTRTIFYDEGYHMLTRDLQGKEVLSDIAKWILHPTQKP